MSSNLKTRRPNRVNKKPTAAEVQPTAKPLSLFELVGMNTGALVNEKHLAYGPSFFLTGRFLKLLYPNGIRPDQYDDALALVRVYDKMNRIAHKKKAFGESPWGDITGYGILKQVADNGLEQVTLGTLSEKLLFAELGFKDVENLLPSTSDAPKATTRGRKGTKGKEVPSRVKEQEFRDKLKDILSYVSPQFLKMIG